MNSTGWAALFGVVVPLLGRGEAVCLDAITAPLWRVAIEWITVGGGVVFGDVNVADVTGVGCDVFDILAVAVK